MNINSRALLGETIFLVLILLLSGCAKENEPPNPITIKGTVATGIAMTGTVSIVGASGKLLTTKISANGKYSIEVADLKAPYIIKASPTDNALPPLYSYSSEVDTIANVTPLTTLTLFLLSGESGLNNLYANWSILKLDQKSVTSAQTIVNANFQPLIDQYLGSDQAKTYDFFRTPFSPDQTGIDAVLEAIDIQYSNNNVEINLPSDPDFEFDININTQSFNLVDRNTATYSNKNCPELAENIPVEFADLAGEHYLAIYDSNNTSFSIGDSRTEYLFKISCDGLISVFNKSGNNALYKQRWLNEAGNISHSITGSYIELKDSSQSEAKSLIFQYQQTTQLYEAKIISSSGNASFSSDPTIRGNKPPQELLGLIGSHPMAKLNFSQTQFEKDIVLTVNEAGTVSYKETGASEDDFIQDWNVRYGRVEILNDTPSAFKITLHDGFTSRIDIYYDQVTSGIYYAENVSVFLYGEKVGDGTYGQLTMDGTDAITLGNTFTPGLPTVSKSDIYRSQTFKFSQYKLNEHLIDLIVTYNLNTGLAMLTDLTWKPGPDNNSNNNYIFCSINCIVSINENERSMEFSNMKIGYDLTLNGKLYY